MCEVSPPGKFKAIERLSHRAALREGMLGRRGGGKGRTCLDRVNLRCLQDI